MNIYEELVKAKMKWQSRNYSTNTYKSQLENNRDNEMNAISNLIFSYDASGKFTEAEVRFAVKLIQNANK